MGTAVDGPAVMSGIPSNKAITSSDKSGRGVLDPARVPRRRRGYWSTRQ